MQITVRIDPEGTSYATPPQMTVTVDSSATFNDLAMEILQVATWLDDLDDLTHLHGFLMPPTMRTTPDPPRSRDGWTRILNYDYDGSTKIDGREHQLGAEWEPRDSFWFMFDMGSTQFVRCRIEADGQRSGTLCHQGRKDLMRDYTDENGPLRCADCGRASYYGDEAAPAIGVLRVVVRLVLILAEPEREPDDGHPGLTTQERARIEWDQRMRAKERLHVVE